MKSRITYLVLAGLTLLSCNDFLEPKSKSEFVPKDASSMNELLLGEAYPTNNTGGLNVFLHLLDDDVTCAPFQEETKETNRRPRWYAAYTWQPEMFNLFNDAGMGENEYNIYKTYYTLILGANAVLDYVYDLKDETNVKNQVIAQALTLRGFYYLTLVNIFGKPYNADKDALGVPLKLTSGIEERYLTRNTVSEVYDQVIKDLLEAERQYQQVPASEQWKKNYRTSLPMVHLLLSRTYLYMEEWQKAADYADSVIANPNFQLYNLNSIDAVDGEGNRVYTEFHNYSSPEAIWLYGNVKDVVNMVGSDYGENNEHENKRSGYCFFMASDELMNSYDETEGDLRKERYIVREQKPTLVDGKQVYLPQAFGKIAIENNYRPKMDHFGRSLRLAEAYLNLSEAAAMLYKAGDGAALTRSLQALNTLRQYRFPTYTNINITDAEQLISFIQRERRRELCFEDHRWFDLRRWGMKAVKHTWIPDATSSKAFTLQENDPSFTLPFPDEVIKQNPSVVQNDKATAPRTN